MRESTCYDRIMTVCKAFFTVLVLACLIFFISYNITDKGIAADFDPKSIVIDDWTVVMEDGTKFRARDAHADEPAFYEPYHLITKLPDEIKGQHFLCFLCFRDTKVMVGDEMRADFVRARDVHLFGGIVKASYLFVPIYEEDAGETVSIERMRGETERKVYPSTVFGTAKEIYLFMMDEYATAFIMYLIILAISLVIVLAGVILAIRMRREIDMLFAGLAVLITTVWLITDSFLYPFVFGHYYIDGVLSYLMCMMIPMPFFLYLNAIQKRRYVKWYAILELLTFASFTLWTVLHFTGIFPFNKALYYLDAVLVIDIIGGLIISIVDIARGHVKEYRYMAIGFLGFAVSSFLQIIVIFTMDLNNDGELLLLGLLFLLVFVVLQQLYELAESDREKQHAMELSDAKTRFLASMSHEIRTPINSILGMNEMILRENHDDTINEYAQNVQSAGKMLLALINDVLDFSKIESGKMEIIDVEYSLPHILADVAGIVRERALAKGLRFDIRLKPDLPRTLFSDEVRIKQILINLLTNAVKYTDSGSVAMIVSGNYETDDVYRLRFDVADTGKGIRAEEQEKLFDAFSRMDMARNRNVEGTGLGLAIVRRIVNAMDGEIRVKSVYGEGSTFSVSLPQQVIDRTPIPAGLNLFEYGNAPKAYRETFIAPDARVLAVDDNAANLSIVKQFLKHTKMEIDCCMNGETAIAQCADKEYDLILLDHMMPDPDGIETLARIRSMEGSKNRNTKAVVLTANAVAGSRQMYLDAGFVDYLTKPLDSHLLEMTVRKYLPGEKVIETDGMDGSREETTDPEEARSAWDMIGELDREMALQNCNGEEDLLIMIIDDIVRDCRMRSDGLRQAMAQQDYKNYRVHAHAIKSNMATIGVNGLFERARKHEYAGRDEDAAFIAEDGEAFIQEYEKFCDRLKQLL